VLTSSLTNFYTIYTSYFLSFSLRNLQVSAYKSPRLNHHEKVHLGVKLRLCVKKNVAFEWRLGSEGFLFSSLYIYLPPLFILLGLLGFHVINIEFIYMSFLSELIFWFFAYCLLCWFMAWYLILRELGNIISNQDLNQNTKWKTMSWNQAWFICCLKTLMQKQVFSILLIEELTINMKA